MPSLMNYPTLRSHGAEATSRSTALSDHHHDLRLHRIIERLRSGLPAGVYLSEEAVADLLGVSKKSLQNLRARKPHNFAQVHPPYVIWSGRRGVRFPREALIEFLAEQEFQSLTRHVHRCR